MRILNLTILVFAFLLGGCGPQFLPHYDAAGTYPFKGYWSGNHAGCTDDFIASLETELTIKGEFPEYDTQDMNDGTLTVLGTTVDVLIEPADRLNSAHIYPADPEVLQTFDDGTEWGLDYIDFQNKQACGSCKDELIFWMFTNTKGCSPNALYDVDP